MIIIDIANFEKVSLQDYPGKVSAICFINGCQLRCPYCHNPDLVLPEKYKTREEDKTLDFIGYITKRKTLIDGVVLSGGEPLMREDLIDSIYKIKDLGLKIKLDTNGIFPHGLKKLLDENLLDYIALDYKGSKNSLNRSVGLSQNSSYKDLYKDWSKSLELVHLSNLDYELRTTVVKELHPKDDLYKMGKELKDMVGSNSPKWFLQGFEEKFDILNSFTRKESSLSSYSKEEMIAIKDMLKTIIPSVSLR
ncbi:MAG: anaerobic ribonucleoside-triphosphate reductase activating protein [Tissierella sp.]|uniref:anaerobic ribonucleoside-triphosphate reductase activating protein n=1 Tax=Tissierella sp. TaxID=41274 RepID=UPI003F972018